VIAAITGSTGFVGKHLSVYLSLRGINVLNLTRDDLSKPDIVLPSADTVIHLAGLAHDLGEVARECQYFKVNYELTKRIYDAFLNSDAKTFIFVSSIKAVAESSSVVLTEEAESHPVTPYGLSKRAAEKYIQSALSHEGKRFYILRPCMIHGPGAKGNLNILYKFIARGYPYPFGAFENPRSFLSIENLCFVAHELLSGEVAAGVYNIADDESLLTSTVVEMIGEVAGICPRIWRLPLSFVKIAARLGDVFNLPLDSTSFGKLTERNEVSNARIKEALGKNLPVEARAGLRRTLEWFQTVSL